ncbi:helix-turn-helix transcriptional regulator [Neobacillus niacini]|uniref:helix-turn-helix transcriptional regulator n=1 Tax=Neobacillus niacini TaxID=86668 RepID=UPI00203AF4CE|nr:response regulator transcription factor [Neobacillus niacini]MCM3689790.1 helix-turn-helix transcriptional regulator [Neobacillus niacini]
MVHLNANIENIRNKCNLIVDSLNLSIFFIDPKGNVIYEDLNHQILNPLLANEKEHFFKHLNYQFGRDFHFPVIRKSSYFDKYMLISVVNDEVFEGTAIIGPILSFPLSEEKIDVIINDTNAFFQREKVIHYYKSLPIIESKKQKSICIFVHHLFNNELISPNSVMNESSGSTNPNNIIEKVHIDVSEILKSNVIHRDSLFEKKILQMVREGRPEELKKVSLLRMEEEVVSVLSKSSYIRSLKNHIISLISLVSRAAIEGGLNEDLAYSLHDSFIQNLEEMQRLDEVKGVAREVLTTFTKNVKQIKDENYSKTVIICKDYIYKNIYQKINHDDIAQKVDLSPKYLSILFKRETGISVSDYIQQTRIDEAKKSLIYSKTSISEIASSLQFNDQSYFTRVFKKVCGITPMQFRERHHLIDK